MFIKKKWSHQFRYALMTVIATVISVGTLLAQNVNVTGTVTDKNGEPLIGANVIIKGTTSLVSTDIDGRYSISVAPSATLQFTSLGYTTQEVAINNRSSISVILEEDALMLEEAVITAEFGMKRVARAVGSSVQTVKADEIAESGRESFTNALQGRISGVTVTSSGGTPGSSTNVVLRNVTSISGSNQPLYVIDGVPMNNSTFDPASGFSSTEYDSRDLDFSSRGNDLNPDDIETMTVLKGAAAAALYGSNASNGAIIITTKKGSSGQGKVSYSNSFRFDQAYGYPDMQDVYGNGAYGVSNYYYKVNYGGPYPDDVTIYDNVAAILQTGFSQTHNLSAEGGTDKVSVRGAASYVDQTGVVKTTDYNRLNLSLNGRAEVTKWLNFDANLSYTTTSNNKALKGSSGPLTKAMTWPMTDDMSNYLDEDGIQMRLPDLYTDTDLLNPLYALYKNTYYDESDRFFTSFGVNITPTKNTFITAKFGSDVGMQTYTSVTHPYYADRSSSSYGSGSYNLAEVGFSDQSINVLAGYNNDWGKFTFAGQVGYHQQENGSNTFSTYGSDFMVIDFASISNCDPSTVVSNTSSTTKRIQAVSGSFEFGYDNMAFLTVRGRNDWSSTLPVENRSYFYPAVEASFIATELPALKSMDAISYLKLRGAIAQVGKDADAESIYPSLETTDDYGGGYRYGYYGPNESLKPEMTTSTEIGFEGRFLNDRINADFTYYWTKCEDQYVTSFRLSYATGFVLNNMNVGSFTTQGWESHIDGDILRTASGFRWNVGLNLSHSTSMVTYLPDNVSEYYNAYTWIVGNIRNGISVGNPITTITGKAYERNDNGDILIDPSTGLPIVSDTWSVLGDRQPDLEFGISTSLSYKNFRLSALLTGKTGATVVNGTKRYMMYNGTSNESVELRESDPVIFTGVLQDGKENSSNPTVNNISVTYDIYGSSIYYYADEEWIEDDVYYLHLSECRLSYTVPSKWLKSVTKNFVSSANIWAAGNDLFTITNYSGIDAVGNSNSAALGGTGGVGIDYMSIPTPRGYSFGVSLTF